MLRKTTSEKIQGLTRTDIIKNKRDEEVVLRDFAKNLKGYESVLGNMESLYSEKISGADGKLILRRFPLDIYTVSMAYFHR